MDFKTYKQHTNISITIADRGDELVETWDTDESYLMNRSFPLDKMESYYTVQDGNAEGTSITIEGVIKTGTLMQIIGKDMEDYCND